MLSVKNVHVPAWQVIPAVFLLTAFMMFTAPIVGMAAARFRDLRFLLPYTAQILFFITPVFWRPSTLAASKINIVKYNPLYYLVDILRAPLLGEAVVANAWLVSILSLFVVVIIWAVSFAAFRRRIAFWI
jgi:ABC-2 type transport system permease protein/lipopolysaccharide transport system permease protein